VGGATGRLQIWLPLKSKFFKHFWPGTGLVKLFEARAQIADFLLAVGTSGYLYTKCLNIPVR